MGKLLASATISFFSAVVLQLRRDPTGALGHETTRKRWRVSAVIMETRGKAREEQGREQHGLAVSSPTSGAANSTVRNHGRASLLLRARSPSGAQREWSARERQRLSVEEVRARVLYLTTELGP